VGSPSTKKRRRLRQPIVSENATEKYVLWKKKGRSKIAVGRKRKEGCLGSLSSGEEKGKKRLANKPKEKKKTLCGENKRARRANGNPNSTSREGEKNKEKEGLSSEVGRGREDLNKEDKKRGRTHGTTI